MSKRRRSLETRLPGMQGKNIVGYALSTLRQRASPPLSRKELCALVKDCCGLDLSEDIVGEVERGTRGVSDYEVVAFARALNVEPSLGVKSRVRA
jgi:hypothetical protein